MLREVNLFSANQKASRGVGAKNSFGLRFLSLTVVTIYSMAAWLTIQ